MKVILRDREGKEIEEMEIDHFPTPHVILDGKKRKAYMMNGTGRGFVYDEVEWLWLGDSDE